MLTYFRLLFLLPAWHWCTIIYFSLLPVHGYLNYFLIFVYRSASADIFVHILHICVSISLACCCCCCCLVTSVMSDSVRPHRWQHTRLLRPWDSPGKNTGVGCHFPLQCMHACKVVSVVSDSLRPHGQQPTRLLCPQHSLGQNTGVGCQFLLHISIMELLILSSIMICSISNAL